MKIQQIIAKGIKKIDLLDLNYTMSNKVKEIFRDLQSDIKENMVYLTNFNKANERNIVLRDRLAEVNKKLRKANSDLVWFRKHFKFEYDKR